jgi:AcrR family transcriptional regulator
MLHNIFEKITIKKICDESGVIRATFYNYFIDKYDCLNSIIYYDFVEDVYENNKDKDILDIVKLLITKIGTNKEFYRLSLSIKDTYEIERILEDNFKIVLIKYLEDNDLKNSETIVNEYFSNSLKFLIKKWLMEMYNMSYEEVLNYFSKFSSTSFLDIYDKKE